MNNAAIDIDHLSFRYGELGVINDLSLRISKGISFCMLGANGSGKTTLIRLITGLLKPAAGRISYFEGIPSSAIAGKIGYMPQLVSLYNELTVEQNIHFFARIYGLRDKKQREQRVNEVIKVIDLWDKRRTAVAKLSGGMKQRVSLGCAIAHNPPLLLLDEPTVGLDPDVRVRFWEFFDRLTMEGATIVITTHTMDDAAHCQQLAFLRQGKVIAQGSPEELKAATGHAGATLEETFLFFIKKSEEGKSVQ